jgi:hypothetical protein
MDMGNSGAENTVPEQGAPRKSGRSPTIAITFTSNLIRLHSDLKEHVKGEYELKEMADYSAMKSYLEKNNLLYFNFSPNSEKPIKASPSTRYTSRRYFHQP